MVRSSNASRLGSLACRRGPALLLVAALACATPAEVPQEAARNADDLLVVDCLLPGQVRQMGGGMTYMTPRRPIKTSARDCEIRGGEYVAFDRASYADALRIWLPRAKEGDAEAQTYVGEIFEKGLGVPADHQAAAQWYTRAAEQGYAAAQINLGQLYELGLGVPQDPKQALVWYRRAAGIEDLDAGFVSFASDAKQYQQLRQQIDAKSAQVASLRSEVKTLNQKIGQAEAQRTATRVRVVEADPKVVALQTTLDRESAVLAQRREELAADVAKLDAEKQALERERATVAVDRQEKERLEHEREQLAVFEQELDRRQRELASLANDLREREAEVTRLADENAAKSRELAALDAEVETLRKQGEAQLAQYAAAVAPAVAEPLPGPSIEIVDPQLVLTRSIGEPTLPVRTRERQVVGRVDAPGGLLSLVVNDVEAKVDGQGFFLTSVHVRRVGTPVRVVAIDQQGKRAMRSFKLRRAEGDGEVVAEAAPVKLRLRDSGVDFGRYYALVIGISGYRSLPRLETSQNDAKAVSALLRDRYGFEVTTLLDPDRYQILSALDALRQQLKEKDNLLVYYAGHGEYDELNERGFWLPVDAEAENRANWISNQAITDLVNAMLAKHVLIVADSCYSGALTDGGVPRVDEDLADAQLASWQSRMVGKRSRTALTSGGLAPVLDEGAGEHSVFADAFLDILRNNHDVLDGRQLYQTLAARVTWKARTRAFRQDPQYAPIRFGGHEAGDFFLLPRT